MDWSSVHSANLPTHPNPARFTNAFCVVQAISPTTYRPPVEAPASLAASLEVFFSTCGISSWLIPSLGGTRAPYVAFRILARKPSVSTKFRCSPTKQALQRLHSLVLLRPHASSSHDKPSIWKTFLESITSNGDCFFVQVVLHHSTFVSGSCWWPTHGCKCRQWLLSPSFIFQVVFPMFCFLYGVIHTSIMFDYKLAIRLYSNLASIWVGSRASRTLVG
jgi:hypothetical protein